MRKDAALSGSCGGLKVDSLPKTNKTPHELIGTEKKLAVARGGGWVRMGEMGEGGQKLQTSSYTIKEVLGM